MSCLNFVDGVLGNSSSGLIEAPSFKKGTINIGDRQKGRISAKSVINCLPNKIDILDSINKLYSKRFQDSLKKVKSPYGSGGAIRKLFKSLKKDLKSLTKKEFYNIK